MYDPVPFWSSGTPAGPGAASPEHERQEVALRKLLRFLSWRSVLDVGVGGGRITDLMYKLRPKAEYTGLDLVPREVLWPDGEFIQSPIEDFRPAAGRLWDLVIASEVLMHVRPEHIADAVEIMLACARKHVVFVEWVPLDGELDAPVADFNFPHDYRALLAGFKVAETRTDRQIIFHVAL